MSERAAGHRWSIAGGERDGAGGVRFVEGGQARRPQAVAVSWAGVHRVGGICGSRQFRDQHFGRGAVRVFAFVGDPLLEPDGYARPVHVGEARHRHGQEPAGGLPGEVLQTGFLYPLGAGGDHRDGDRPRGVHRGGAGVEPALRDTAFPGGTHHRGWSLRHPLVAEPRFPAAGGGDRGDGRRDRRRLRLPDVLRRAGGRQNTRRPLHAAVRRDRERAARNRNPRRDRNAARDLLALRPHPAQGGGQDGRREAEDLPLRACGRGHSHVPRRGHKREHAHHGGGPLPRERPDERLGHRRGVQPARRPRRRETRRSSSASRS